MLNIFHIFVKPFAEKTGGHAGLINAFALVSEVRSFFKGTILLAGAVSKGSDVAAARAMGADLAYVGTRFLATHEASVDSKYKVKLLKYVFSLF